MLPASVETMIRLARKNLLTEPVRLMISVMGVALSVFLIAFLVSMYRGWDEKIGGYIEGSEIDVWVARDGTTDFLNAASIVPEEEGNELEALADVQSWSPLIVRPMAATNEGGDAIDISLIGYRVDPGLGRPPAIASGENLPRVGEAVIDESISDRFGVDIGDTISVVGEDLRVVGISKGGNFIFWQAVFVDYAEAERILDQPGFATFLVFDLDDSSFAHRIRGARSRPSATTSRRKLAPSSQLPPAIASSANYCRSSASLSSLPSSSASQWPASRSILRRSRRHASGAS